MVPSFHGNGRNAQSVTGAYCLVFRCFVFSRYGVPIKSSGRVLRYQRVTRLNADASKLDHVRFVQSQHRGRISVRFAQETQHRRLCAQRWLSCRRISFPCFILDIGVVVRSQFNQFAPCCIRQKHHSFTLQGHCVYGNKMVNNEMITFTDQ